MIGSPRGPISDRPRVLEVDKTVVLMHPLEPLAVGSIETAGTSRSLRCRTTITITMG